MLAAGFDQFVINVIGGHGYAHQVRYFSSQQSKNNLYTTSHRHGTFQE